MIRKFQPLVSTCLQAFRRSAEPGTNPQLHSRLWTLVNAEKAAAPASAPSSIANRMFSNSIIDQERKNIQRWFAGLAAVPPVAKILGYAGALPFLLLTPPVAQTFSIFLPMHVVENSAAFQVSYGACIVSFLGAVHWGMALSSTLTGSVASMIAMERYAWSVLPCLLAWPTTQMHPGPGSLVMSVLLPVVYYVDKRFGKRGFLPQWYMALRAPLTAAATFGMATTAAYYVYQEQERAEQYHRARQIAGEEGGAAEAVVTEES